MPNYIRTKQIDQADLSGFFTDSIGSQSGVLLQYISGVTLNETVLLTGNQNVSGIKTFVDGVNLNNIDNLSLSGVDITITSGIVILTNPVVAPNIVYNTGNQNVSGNKTFLNNLNVSGDVTIAGTLRYNEIIDTTVTGNLSGYTGIFQQVVLAYAQGNTPTTLAQAKGIQWLGLGGTNYDQTVYAAYDGFQKIGINFNREGLTNLEDTIIFRPLKIEAFRPIEVSGTVIANNLVYNTGTQTISGVKTFANGANQILNTTYSTLTGLKATSGLLSGQLYRISDFVLKWNNQSINDQTVKTAASGEPLIVTALSNNKIHHIAQSEIYPQDTIYYNIDASGSYSWGTINNNAAIPDFKGWIYRRVDNLLNIDIPYDWRNITVNCCKPDVSSVPNYSGNYQYTRLDYVKETGNNSNRGKLYYSVVTGNSGNALSNSNFWNPVSDFVESGTFFSTDESYGFRALYDDPNLGDFIINLPVLTSSRIQQPTFTSTLTGLGAFTLNNVKNIKIEGGYSNVISNGFSYNNIGNTFISNTIGNNFSSNKIGNNFYFNTIGNDFGSNNIGNNFSFNITSQTFSYNNIGNSFGFNTISQFYFYSNIIGNAFYSNTIGDNFSSNKIGNDFYSNVIGDVFSSNNIGNTFHSNTIGTSFNSNTIGTSFNSNTIGNAFYSNTIGTSFNSNTIGNSFNYNTSEDNFNSINFSTSTHVYNSYNTTLFKNSANSMRLRYFNSSDQLVVTDPTA